jgi:Lar family restriction alleviation protein
MSEQLKPCPFCGSEAVLSVTESLFMEAWTEGRCDLGACDAVISAQGSGPDKAENVIAAWNRRAGDPA